MAEETKVTEGTTTGAEDKGTQSTAGTEETTPKAKTGAEIRAEMQKEFDKQADKRVTDAIKKRDREWADKQAKEKMTADERKQVEDRERAEAQAKKDYELTIKGLRLDVVDAVAELGLDAGFRNLIAVEDLASISDDAERREKLTERVKGMKSLFDAEVAKAVAKAKQDFLKGETPKTGSSKTAETSYDTAKKDGNVKGMVSAKLQAYRNKDEE